MADPAVELLETRIATLESELRERARRDRRILMAVLSAPLEETPAPAAQHDPALVQAWTQLRIFRRVLSAVDDNEEPRPASDEAPLVVELLSSYLRANPPPDEPDDMQAMSVQPATDAALPAARRELTTLRALLTPFAGRETPSPAADMPRQIKRASSENGAAPEAPRPPPARKATAAADRRTSAPKRPRVPPPPCAAAPAVPARSEASLPPPRQEPVSLGPVAAVGGTEQCLPLPARSAALEGAPVGTVAPDSPPAAFLGDAALPADSSLTWVAPSAVLVLPPAGTPSVTAHADSAEQLSPVWSGPTAVLVLPSAGTPSAAAHADSAGQPCLTADDLLGIIRDWKRGGVEKQGVFHGYDVKVGFRAEKLVASRLVREPYFVVKPPGCKYENSLRGEKRLRAHFASVLEQQAGGASSSTDTVMAAPLELGYEQW